MDSPPPARTAIAALFERESIAGEAIALSLPGGSALFRAGEAAETLYLLTAGRLAASMPQAGGNRFLGVIRPGEPAGEFALIAGASHAADVIALRDSELLALPKDAFLRAAASDAQVMGELAALVVARVRHPAGQQPASDPQAFGFVGVGGIGGVRELVRTLALAVEALGYKAAVAGSEAQHQTPAWFSDIEKAHDFVLYAAEAGEAPWLQVLCRQIDRLFMVAAGAGSPVPGPFEAAAFVHSAGPADLILLQADNCVLPTGSAAWEALLLPRQIVHVRRSHAPDIARLARMIAARAVGLVLSGGAARAFAHIGALRALKHAQVPIDFLAGVSMGAIIAAGEAMGWSDEELDWRIRKAFVESSPVDDIALPLIALTRGRKMRARLAEHFGDGDIVDLWRPFFCLSSNLTTGDYCLHRHGRLRDALTASASLPGLLPPAIWGEDVLVDGAVMKNFPVDVMRAFHSGPIVGVDVTRGRSVEAKDVSGDAVTWRWLVSGAWRRGPPIVSLLMRAATVGAERDLAAAREAADVLILPEVDAIEIRDWKDYDAAVREGEIAAGAAIAGLLTPISEIRRRPSVADDRPHGAGLIETAL